MKNYIPKNERKSSSATIVPPPLLHINCINTGTDAFYRHDNRSVIAMATTPTTVASLHDTIPYPTTNKKQLYPTLQTLVQKVKSIFNKSSSSSTKCLSGPILIQTQEQENKSYSYYKSMKKKLDNNKKLDHSTTIKRSSFSDPQLSPGSTAIDNDEERSGYFNTSPSKSNNTCNDTNEKSKKSPRKRIAAVLMILFGALIAVTFVLVGLGKALENNGSVSTASTSVSNDNNSTSTANTTAAVSVSTSTLVTPTVTVSVPPNAESTILYITATIKNINESVINSHN